MQVQSNTPYAVLEEGGEDPPMAQARPAVVIVSTVEKRKRTFGCGFCCLATLLVVLLCSLLVPRTPYIGFREFAIGWDADAERYTVKADVRFKSRQPVSVEWKDLEVKLQWLLDESDDSYTVQEVAKFKKSSEFTTKAFDDKHIEPSLDTVTLVPAAALFAQCKNDYAVVRFKGHVKSKDSGKKYNLETDWHTVWNCYL